jgi:hypothetical protein
MGYRVVDQRPSSVLRGRTFQDVIVITAETDQGTQFEVTVPATMVTDVDATKELLDAKYEATERTDNLTGP